MTCTQLIQLLAQERIDLKTEIERDKWFLSEKEHRDVGFERAEQHFIENYLNSWAEGYKMCYCSLVCPQRGDCHHV